MRALVVGAAAEVALGLLGLIGAPSNKFAGRSAAAL
jgi:hypothetical protein